uniref:BED-type domain-containing protein n=1 Tax=Vitis vinifera TaxID=29760 RepID=A5BXX4_VITVI|nr:hypothetical protein VITISV_038472 [Vitis vinifera]
MASKHDIGWEHAEPVGSSRRTTKCKYCGKLIHGGITRLKQHIAHISGQVEGCPRVPIEVSHSVRQHMSNTSKEKAQEIFYEIDEGDSDDEIEEVAMANFERRQMKQAMKESRRIFEEGGQEHQKGGSSSQPSNARIKRGMTRSFNVREGASIPPKGIYPYMFPSKQKSIKSLFSTEGVKKVGKAISKFFLFNAIPFNAADSGSYYQSMIDTIAEAGPDIKGPMGYHIGNTYFEEKMQELEVYITTLKAKWPIYGCTIMCDGWSSKTRKSIINFMIYYDRSMIYHSSVDTTNIPKTTDYIFSLMDKVIEEVGEEHVVQVVTDNEASFKVVGMLLMEKRKHLFWSPCVAHCIDLKLEDIASMKQKETLDQAKMITGFIYNSLKVVNLMKVFTKDRDLLRPGITRFATKFISLESLICYETDLKRMCTTNEWREFNKDRSRKILRDKVKLFVDSQGEFGSALTKKAINQSLPGLPTNEEGRERDVDSRHKGKASRTISSSSSSDDGDNGGSRRGGGTSGGNRGVGGTSEGTGGDGSTGGGYVSQIIDHGYRLGIWEQRKHLEILTTFPSDDDYSSGHDYHRSNYHRIDEHLQILGIGSRSYFRGVDDRSYHNFRDRDSSSSTFSRNGFDRFPMIHPEGYSNTGTRASDSYGYYQSSSSSSIAY